jgi:transcriptional regulator with XRE-family HTH domain
MDIRKQIGINIRKRRDALGLSQEALAHESGIHRTYISGLERGIRNPTVTIVQSIAVALDVSPSKLLEEK